MQLNTPKSNTSNLIRQSESARKKAVRRLIGSIFMLFTALIILLNVTTKVKPIPVNPKVIEISSNTSAPVRASAPVQKLVQASAPINASNAVAANTVTASTAASSPEGHGFKAGVISSSKEADNSTQAPAETQPISTSPKIISMNLGTKPSPQDILNGNASSKSEMIYYIQIAAGQNKAGLEAIQTHLAGKGIKTFVQNAKNNNNMYRLRAGPFKDKGDADEKLSQIQGNLNQ